MKTNKSLIIGLAAAGVTIAAAIIFLTTTKTGKKTMKNWSMNGKKLAAQAEDIIGAAKKKFSNLKEDLETKDDEVVTQSYA